ncbi:MAG: hypothetical protein IJV17_01845 [Prevotella sp.]|nr:hypothetical protein [Prevotella sp.]
MMNNEKTPIAITDYFQIRNVDDMDPFFMNVVSGTDLWTFVSSNGGITAGRRSADWTLFPYDTDDRITASAENTGSKTLIRRTGETRCWEPFSVRSEGIFSLERNLYKSRIGNSVIFEEVNQDWKICFRWQWTPGDRFGFQREVTLVNLGTETVNLEVLDGIQNVMPCGVPSALYQASSNLVNAYKQTQLEPQTGMGLFCLSAIIIDRAEPSEALRCNVVWQTGLEKPVHLLSSAQIPAFRKGQPLEEETLVKGECGAYLLGTSFALTAGEKKSWTVVADVMKDQTEIVALREQLRKTTDMKPLLDNDLEVATALLVQLVAQADGVQTTADEARTARHFSNTMFNIMRGGIPLEQPTKENPLPLGFSRRHGDPTRPWNKFNINTTDPVTRKPVLDYEGNWRDIFQNWEALAVSYPMLLEAMTEKFLSCTTADGYNPYRITKAGFDWETEDPADPWSYIGYWGDHQIIYLLRLMEAEEAHVPGQLSARLDTPAYPFANVPYRIKPYQEILQNPKDTIRFDAPLSDQLKKEMAIQGVDAALLKGPDGTTVKASLLEKVLVSLLAKLSNFIPNGGIWMNTQRPEWNDANNALVGGGLSVVTLCYLHRALRFYRDIVAASQTTEFTLSQEVYTWMEATGAALALKETQDVMDALGDASTIYRQKIYTHSFCEGSVKVQRESVLAFLSAALEPVEKSIRANRRDDGLYHSYNIMELSAGRFAGIRSLSEMLEGQVAVLSSGVLSSAEALAVLDALRNSKLWREDQKSYMLYPNKELPGFLEKNCLPENAMDRSPLLRELVQKGDKHLVSQDVCGTLHFNGTFRNAGDLAAAMNTIGVAENEQKTLLDLFEETFDHKAFTGRSGTFYAYEGLGSIYWHMVSKLLVATQECYFLALDANAPETADLAKHYYAILEGTGIHKSAREYGAFSTDAYSHTPWGKGVRQPGMTGQVKEDILCRFGELGVRVKDGKVSFHPTLLKDDEFLPDGTLSFSYCGAQITYHKVNGDGMTLSETDSARLFARQLRKLEITV